MNMKFNWLPALRLKVRDGLLEIDWMPIFAARDDIIVFGSIRVLRNEAEPNTAASLAN